MSAASERISQYEIKFGTEAVETFLDAVLAIQEHVDPSHYRHKRNEDEQGEQQKNQSKFTEYNDLWNLESAEVNEKSETKRFPPEPEKDILSFIETHSFHLEAWQRDILTMLREEMLYFFPQMETKIMNEGWASYWHIRILRELDLTSEETLEFAKLNSSVVQPSQNSLNPYYLGLKIFEDIERRWDKPTDEDKLRFGYKGGQGRAKMFEVREFDSDTSFIRSYLTKELVDDLDLYVFEKKGAEWKITDKTWENVRDQLVYSRINGGFPYLYVEDGNYLENGELYLKHAFEGNELDLKYIERTLPYVVQLWGKPVHLQTTIEDKAVLFSHDGKKSNRRFL
jgi:stage V sporulation protein R